jgi:hypothetical protein
MNSEPTTPRTYRFPPRDSTGWLLGLSGAQCLLLAAGLVTAGVLLSHGAPSPVVAIPIVAALAGALAPIDGQPAHTLAAPAARHATRAKRWHAELPLLVAGVDRVTPDLPDWLGPVRLVTADGDAARRARLAGAGVVVDRDESTVTAVLRVRGREFALLDRAEQDRLLFAWGDTLGGFCTERNPITRVWALEWAAPAGAGEQLAYLADHAADPDSPAAREYQAMVAAAGPMATRHDVLLAVTVSTRRLRRRGRRGPLTDAAVEALGDELRLLAQSLELAGLADVRPLTRSQFAAALRARLDPAAQTPIAARARTLADAAVAPHNAGPLTAEIGWRHVTVDTAVHASYWIAEWPRLDVGPNWLEPLLLHAGGTRTVAICYEPVPPSRSTRQIERDAVRLAADEEQRSRAGFRLRARDRRAKDAVATREAELVAGYPELGFCGLITVTAATVDELDRCCADYEQAAAQAGLELRRLDGRHDLALAASLPLGRPAARPRLA